MQLAKFVLPSARTLFKTPIYSFRSTQPLFKNKDFYQILGVKKDSTQDEIKKHYYKLVQKHHPDKNPDDQEKAKEKLAEINAAYDTLKDENKRKMYDMTGMTGDEQAQAGGNPFGGAGGFWGGQGGQGGPSAEDIFGDFENFFNMGQGGERIQKDVTFMESVNGVNKKISFEKKGICPTCSGSKCKPGTAPSRCTACGGRGAINYRQGPMTIQMQCTKCAGSGSSIKYPCTTCRGSGVARIKADEEVQIPKGINTGQNLRMPKKGNDSENGGMSGDLIIKVNVKPDAYFSREGYDITTTQFVTLSEAVLGTKIKVKTLSGEKDIEVKPGTSHGEKVKVKGLGINHLPPNNNQIGDHVITLKIHVPKTLTNEQKELYQKLSEVEQKIDPQMNMNYNQQQANQSSQSNRKQSQSNEETDENIFNKFKNMWGK